MAATQLLLLHKCCSPGRHPSYGPPPPNTPPTHTHTQNFLYMLDAGARPDYRPNPRLVCCASICSWGGGPTE